MTALTLLAAFGIGAAVAAAALGLVHRWARLQADDDAAEDPGRDVTFPPSPTTAVRIGSYERALRGALTRIAVHGGEPWSGPECALIAEEAVRQADQILERGQ